MGIVFLFFHSLGLLFFVAGGHVAGDRLAFSLRLGAFDGDDFACHNLLLFFLCRFGGFGICSHFVGCGNGVGAGAVDGAKAAEFALADLLLPAATAAA